MRFKICSKLERTILDPPTFDWCLIFLRFLLAGQPESITWKEQRVRCTYDIPSLIDNFWGRKEDEHLTQRIYIYTYRFVREIKFPQSTNPRGDYFLKTNALARQWHREFVISIHDWAAKHVLEETLRNCDAHF